MPSYKLKESDLSDGQVDIVSLLVLSGLCSSRGDARRNVEQGGVTFGEEKITDTKKTFSQDEIGEGRILRRGKKNFIKIISA